jgi:hypothetical protein
MRGSYALEVGWHPGPLAGMTTKPASKVTTVKPMPTDSLAVVAAAGA